MGNRNILHVLMAVLLGVGGCAFSEPAPDPEPPRVPAEARPAEADPAPEPEPPAYRALKTREALAIDGALDEPDWQRAESVVFYVYQRNTEPISKTTGKVMWDENYLYVGFEAEDKDLFGYQTERNSTTCRDDCLEVFFKIDPDDRAYYNFEINILGTVFDAFSPAPRFAGNPYRWSNWWNCEDLQVGIRLRGTPNDPTDVDEGWDMEVAVPFASLPSLEGQPPEAGDMWRFHLARYDFSVYLPGGGREVTSSARFPRGRGVNFHAQATWPALVFVDEAAGLAP